MNDSVIAISGLHKSFGKFKALNDLELEVRAGEVHGFLGPNGAGKSTTIRVLLGLLRADSGSVRLLGGDPWSGIVELHKRLAYVPGDVALWPNMSGGEAIDLLAAMRGPLNEARRAELIERFDLDPSKRGRQYSKGNRQKVAIIAALASEVELLILDEPTSGLDPLMEKVFQEVILEAKERGTSVLLSSHILSEVEALTDRISIIRAGKTVRTGTLDDLRGHAKSTVTASLAAALTASDLRAFDAFGPDSVIDSPAHNLIELHVDSSRVGEAVTQLAAFGLKNLTVEPPTLESLFLDLYDNESDQ